jgi:hypothetical protein
MREGPYAMHTTIHGAANAAATWTNMPAADTFLFGSYRHVMPVDVSGFVQVRLKVNKQATAGAAGSKLILRFAQTFSTSVANYADIGVTEVSVPIDTTNTVLESGWVDISGDVPPGDDDVFLAVIGSGGNGTLDPQFGTISVSFH